MERVARWIVQHSVLTLFVAAAATLLLAARLPWLDVDLAAGDPALDAKWQPRDAVVDRMVFVDVDRPSAGAPEPTVDRLLPMVEALRALDGVEQAPVSAVGSGRVTGIVVVGTVRRLARARLARRIHEALARREALCGDLLDDVLLSPTLARAVWASQPEPVQDAMGSLEEATRRVPDAIGRAAHRLLGSRRVRRVVLREAPRESRRREAALVDAVAAVVARHRDGAGAPVTVNGSPASRVRRARRLGRVAVGAVAGGAAVVMLVVLAASRSVACAAVAVGAALLSGLWALGLMGWMGVSLTGPMVVVGPMLLGVGGCLALRVMGAGAAESPRAAAARGLARAGVPVLLGANALAAGCLWVALSGREGAAELGLVGALGALCATVAALTVVPGLLRWVRPARLTRVGALAGSLALAAAVVAGGLAVSSAGGVGTAQAWLLTVAFGVLVVLAVARCLLWEEEIPTRSCPPRPRRPCGRWGRADRPA